MDIGVGVWAILIVAAITLAVAALVLFLDFNQRVHRAFALFLVLRAMMDGMLLISEGAGPGERLRMYWFIAVPFAALHFCLAYRRRHGRRSDTRPAWKVPLSILVIALAFELLYFLNHDLYAGPPTFGPLNSFSTVRYLAFAGVAWVFATEVRHTTSHSGRRALLLASVGFALNPWYFCFFELSERAMNGSIGWTLDDAFYALSILLVFDAMRRLLGSTTATTRTVVASTFGAWFVLALASLILFEATGREEEPATTVLRILSALSALAVPICVTYALVRHRLFDAEVKLRFAIKGTTIAAAFVGVFFVVSEAAQQFFGEKTGDQYYGIAAAGLLVFALAPLQRLADKLANKAVDSKRAVQGTQEERVQIYREQLEIAWRDGRLTAKERLLFARLQERLGIPADEATRLETEILSALSQSAAKGHASTA